MKLAVYRISAIIAISLMIGTSFGVLITGKPTSAPNTEIDDEGLDAYKINGVRYTNPNDDDSIQDAIDDLSASGGLVIVKGGEYSIAVSIKPVSNIAIVGVGKESHITVVGGVNCYGLEGTSLSFVLIKDVWFTGPGGTVGDSCGIAFAFSQNITVDGAMLNNFPNDPIIFTGGNSRNTLIENCILWNNDEEINIRGVSDVQVLNNRFNNCTTAIEVGDRLPWSSQASRVLISGNIISTSVTGIWMYGRTIDVTICDNILSSITTYGIQLASVNATYFPENITISNNRISDTQRGVYIAALDWKNVLIHGNMFSSISGYGIDATTAGKGLSISGNYFSKIDYPAGNGIGVRISGIVTNISIENNDIYIVDAYGIYISVGITGAQIVGNHINTQNGGTGISLTKFNTSIISNNFVYSPGGSSILLADSSNTTICSNRAIGTRGVYSTGISDYLILIGNVFRGCSTANYTMAGSHNIAYGNSAK